MQPQSGQLMDDAASPASSAIGLLLGLPGTPDPPTWVCLSFLHPLDKGKQEETVVYLSAPLKLSWTPVTESFPCF